MSSLSLFKRVVHAQTLSNYLIIFSPLRIFQYLTETTAFM